MFGWQIYGSGIRTPGTGRERHGKGPVDLFSEQPAAAGKKGGHWSKLSIKHH